MAQLSRPYQIALVALAVLALVWFVALRHPGGESSSAPAPSAPSAASSSSSGGGSSAAGKSSVYHGSAPGVESLTKDIAKAHQAVAQSQRNAQQLQRKSAQASGEATSGGAASSAAAGATHGSASRSSSASATHAQGSAHASAAGAGAEAAPRAAALESDLTRGKVGVVLFWNPKASDDRHVHEQLQSLSHGNRRIALQVANSKEVSAFGQFTRTVQVLGTPTVLVVNRQGQVTTVTGLTDIFSVRQAIGDATKGAGRVQAPRLTSWTPTSSRKQFIEAANRLCKRAPGPGPLKYQTPTQVQAAIGAIASTAAGIYQQVEGLKVPSKDRAFVHRQFALVLAALHREATVLDPGTRLQRRARFLQAQADGDQAYNGLHAYGLASCV